jgi:hypothetical protein
MIIWLRSSFHFFSLFLRSYPVYFTVPDVLLSYSISSVLAALQMENLSVPPAPASSCAIAVRCSPLVARFWTDDDGMVDWLSLSLERAAKVAWGTRSSSWWSRLSSTPAVTTKKASAHG